MSLKLAVVGCGRMGKLHARVLSEKPTAELVCVVDQDHTIAQAVARQCDCRAVDEVVEAVELVDAAVIAVPTVAHLDTARPFLAAGKPVLIEKPIANNVAAAEQLVALAQKHGTSIQVGHTERFNPVVLAMREHALDPKYIEAHRISPFTFRSVDVGVVLDMMIHDIDLVLMLTGSKVVDVLAIGTNVVGEHEDMCNARLVFDNGCVANLTASRLGRGTARTIRVFTAAAYVSVDYAAKTGVVVHKNRNQELFQMTSQLPPQELAQLAESTDYTALLKVEDLAIDDSIEPLRRQAETFCRTVVEGAPPTVSGRDGLVAVELATRIVQRVKEYRWDRQHIGTERCDER